MASRRTRLHLLASRAHKWLAIIVGVQLLLWFTSGALMSFLPIDRVHGDHLVDRKAGAMLPAQIELASPSLFAAAAPIESVTIRMRGNRPVALLTSGGKVLLFDARTARPLPMIDGGEAEAIARAAWLGKTRPDAQVERITAESTEYRGTLPAWRVSFDDSDATRVYVEATTGRISAVRSSTWRLYDFFWGLHIMDWQNHENFNSPWLLAFAVGGLALWLGGAVLLYMRWPWRRRMQ